MADKYANGRTRSSKPYRLADGRWGAKVSYRDEWGQIQRVAVYAPNELEIGDRVDEVRRRLGEGLPASDDGATVAQVTALWLTTGLESEDRKASTKATYSTLARKHIVGRAIGGVSLKALKPATIQAWLVEMRRAGLAPSTARQTFTVLKMVLRFAQRNDMIARNPADAVERPRVAHREAAYLSPTDVQRLLGAASSSRYAPLFELLVNTGLRRGEALALMWRDIDLDERTLRVRGTLTRVDGDLVVTDTKTAKSRRVVHVSPTVERILKGLKARQAAERLASGSVWHQTGYVFTTEFGEPSDPRNALRAITVAAKKVGLGGVGLHTLRHSAASVMLTNGVPLKVVSEVLGHSSVAITGDVYGHVAPDIAADALDRLGGALSLPDMALGGENLVQKVVQTQQ
ncbi:tyrosine-type recombinase/integrase [Demequina lutea]|uniref:Integrase n=1 Tax=Demequina lutea TaxID=431489 RepID=A0A7Z0CK57_9MICO|nr:site-specific integrase [Demequina lutea]NYI41507.1 integrase [Demequina lutea]